MARNVTRYNDNLFSRQGVVVVSVIIPARNEIYLQKTIESVLSAAEGEIEVIAVLDGYWPDPPIKDNPRVTLIHHTEAIGQRPSINEAVRIAKGKYIFKIDAHCKVDKGIDVKLAADCEYDWTVIPRQYVLDAEKWEPKWRKKSDFLYFNSPNAPEQPMLMQYYDAKCYRAYPKEYRAYKKAKWRQGDICDSMCSLGAAWFMHKDRFWELGGLDENHAHWGQMAVEMACKAWLSGGRQVVNKKTWYAHQWRKKPPWKLSDENVKKSREYSIKFWTEGKWPLQKHPLKWLADKFAPVPTWNGQKIQDLTLLYYTANRISEHFSDKVKGQIVHAAGKVPIVSVSQKPIEFGDNICVGDIGRSLQNIYKQVLIGAKKVRTKYVALVEDDCLYTPEHFTFRPKACFAYNLNRWCLHQDLRLFSYRRRPILSQCIAQTKYLIECLEQRMKIDVPKKYSGEMGLFEKQLGLKEYPYETFETEEPNVVICHNKNTSGRKYIGKDAEPCHELAPWGQAEKVLDAVLGEEKVAKFGRSSWKNWQHSYICSIVFPMDEIMSRLYEFADKRRKGRAEKRIKVLPPFIKAFADKKDLTSNWNTFADKSYTDEQLKEFAWFGYLCELYPNWSKDHRERRVLEIMRETITLYLDIWENGLKSPLDMWRTKNGLVLHRGWRRLIIMNELHERGLRDFARVPVRVFKDIHVFRKYNPSPKWAEGPMDMSSIHGLAMQQFCDMGVYATDKYWVHGYTRQYDRHFSHLRDKPIKLLEIGVLRGASILLWRAVFLKGQIFGLDKNTAIWQNYLKDKDRVKIFVGRQEDEAFIQSEVVPSGPYDIVIDDGGHTPEEQLSSFEQLWPNVKSGGIYVIEDLHGNYWNKRAKNGPLMAERLKTMIDEVIGTNDSMEVRSLSCYYNICFIEKI